MEFGAESLVVLRKGLPKYSFAAQTTAVDAQKVDMGLQSASP